LRVSRLFSSGWIAVLTGCIAFMADVPSGKSADFPPPAPVAVPAGPLDQPAPMLGPGDGFEARFGSFYHGVGSPEKNTFDLILSISAI